MIVRGPLTLLPAVDIVDGMAVRLVRGNVASESRHGSAVAAALQWQDDGAEWIHLVDLDAAFGRGDNTELLTEIIGLLDVRVQLSGGISDDESLARALATGCARVNLSSAALANPHWCSRVISDYGDKVAVALDAKLVADDYLVWGRGCPADGGKLWEAVEFLRRAGCRRIVVTDAVRDGTLNGPNLDLLRQVIARTDAAVIASGGVSSLGDLSALADLTAVGLEGAIIGKALYAGRFTLAQARTAVSRRATPAVANRSAVESIQTRGPK